jgi:hypothetical protein
LQGEQDLIHPKDIPAWTVGAIRHAIVECDGLIRRGLDYRIFDLPAFVSGHKNRCGPLEEKREGAAGGDDLGSVVSWIHRGLP